MGIKKNFTATEQLYTGEGSTDVILAGKISHDDDNAFEITAGGAATFASVESVGALTATAGIVRAAITAATCPVYVNGFVPDALTVGTDTTPTAGTIYGGQVFIPSNRTLTGIGFLIGTVGGTDDVIVSLYDADGALVANSVLTAAAPTVGTLATFQQVAFTATYAAQGPALYYVGVSVNGNTSRLRVQVLNGGRGIAQAGVYATLDAIATPPTTGAVGAIIAYVY